MLKTSPKSPQRERGAKYHLMHRMYRARVRDIRSSKSQCHDCLPSRSSTALQCQYAKPGIVTEVHARHHQNNKPPHEKWSTLISTAITIVAQGEDPGLQRAITIVAIGDQWLLHDSDSRLKF